MYTDNRIPKVYRVVQNLNVTCLHFKISYPKIRATILKLTDEISTQSFYSETRYYEDIFDTVIID